MTGEIHRYATRLQWSGSTAGGYDAYDRGHTVTAPPAAAELQLSADPAFLGDPGLVNPEQLLLAAASSCQLLSFLAVAARARLTVVDYRDDAAAEMPERPDDGGPARITRIELRPHITLTGEPARAKVERLVHIAHDECFIANSVRCEIVVVPTLVGVV